MVGRLLFINYNMCLGFFLSGSTVRPRLGLTLEARIEVVVAIDPATTGSIIRAFRVIYPDVRKFMLYIYTGVHLFMYCHCTKL